MVDGGRVQTRADDEAPGVTDPAWREVKVACCQTLASPVHATDPQPQPPSQFVDPTQAARLAAEIKSRSRPARSRAKKAAAAAAPRRRRRRGTRLPRGGGR